MEKVNAPLDGSNFGKHEVIWKLQIIVINMK